jgi:soluble lytic murein transglycosylase-like protein
VKPVFAIIALCLCSCASIHGPQCYVYSLKYPWMTDEIYQICATESARNELPLSLVLAVIDAESGGDTWAMSSARARGLMQVMACHWYKGNPLDLHDPTVNVRVGCHVLAHYLTLARGELPRALKYYNAGPNGKKWNWKYINKIMRNVG